MASGLATSGYYQYLNYGLDLSDVKQHRDSYVGGQENSGKIIKPKNNK